MPFFKTAVCVLAAGLLVSPTVARSTGGFHWEKLHIFHTVPTEVFARLGLTHITRHGYTRGQKKDPDPTFPAGLTDVVPYDAGHTLLVRGTVAGVALFRRRVLAADVPDPRWQVSLTLLRREGEDFRVLAGQSKEVVGERPVAIAFDADGKYPQYQVRVRINRDGSLAVTCWTALSLAPPAGATTVLVPTQVWAPPITKDVRLGDTLTFDDRAADRAAARQKLDQPAADSTDDYQVQVQFTPEASGPAPIVMSPGGPLP